MESYDSVFRIFKKLPPKRIIEKKQVTKETLEELEKKVLESSVLIFSFLKDDIKTFNKENFIQAHQTFEKLKFLLKN